MLSDLTGGLMYCASSSSSLGVRFLNRCLTIAVACLWSSLGIAVVSAQEAGAGVQNSDAASSDAVARGLFEAARASYAAGKYEDALKYFQQAYDLSQRAALLYNIGQAADRLHQDQRTVEAFRLYLERVPDAPNRAEVEGRLRSLERLVELEAAEAQQRRTDATAAGANTEVQTTPGPASATAPSDDGPGIAPWLVIGTGSAVLVGGVVLGLIGAGQISDVENAKRDSMYSDFRSKADSGPTLATTGVVLMSLGAVGVAAGLVWMLSASDDHSTQVAIGPTSVHFTGAL
jgi:tetratricopeptide (TPR) repeat protein